MDVKGNFFDILGPVLAQFLRRLLQFLYSIGRMENFSSNKGKIGLDWALKITCPWLD